MNGVAARKARVDSVDLLRGLIMAIMMLDHTRDFVHSEAFNFDPTNVARTYPILFFTRWITHFCAPLFVFLAGTGAYFQGMRGKPKGELTRFLVTRGLWFIFVELAILGENDTHLATGETGEIAIRTAASIKCYWKAPEATAALFTADGYVRTGDIGYVDEDDYLFIVDRKKDIIIRGGENISSAEVEAACYACPEVAEASVFAAPDERLGEVPVAVIHAKTALTADELRTFLETRIAKYKVPEQFIFSAEPLPRLGTGKIDRRALKARYAQ